MRKVVAYHLLSLDGVATRPEEFITDWDPVMGHNLHTLISFQDDVLLGRQSYDEWSRYWPQSETEPFASFINNTPKHVATSSPLDGAWNASARIEGDVATFVRTLREGPGGDIGVHASISLTQSLLAEDLIDELRLVVAPAVQISGRRLFEQGLSKRWTLHACDTSPSGCLILCYRRPAGATP